MASRPARERPHLSRERLVDEALRLVDEEGFDALTMRHLAAALGVDPMAAYHYVPSKRALVRLMVERVFAALRLPRDQIEWRQRVLAWARAYRDVALAHPNLIFALVTDVEAVGVAAVHANEALYAALEDAGLGPWEIAGGAGLLADFVNGFVLGVAAAGHTEAEDPLGREMASRASGEFPVQRRVLESLADFDTDHYFEWAVRAIITGLEAQSRGQG